MNKHKRLILSVTTCIFVLLIVLLVIYMNNANYETGFYKLKYDQSLDNNDMYRKLCFDTKPWKTLANGKINIIKHHGQAYLRYSTSGVSGNYSGGIDAFERTDDTLYVYTTTSIDLGPCDQALWANDYLYEVPLDMFKGTYNVEFIPVLYVSGKPYDIISTTTNRKTLEGNNIQYENIHEQMMAMNNENMYIEYFAIHLKSFYGNEYADKLDRVIKEYTNDKKYQMTTTINVNNTEWIVYYTVVPMENH